jgi:hypothetical protein
MHAFSAVLQRFIGDAPFCVMTRALLENVFAPAKLDQLFDRHAQVQQTQRLLFSTTVDILTEVVLRIRPSVGAAHRDAKRHGRIAVSAEALYEKLRGTEPAVCRALLCHCACEARAILAEVGPLPVPLLKGYDLRILDGNHIASTQKRLGALRGEGRAALPGLAVAVLDPQARLIEDVIFCPDGHAQECTLALGLLEHVLAGQLYITDRHFCTSDWLFGLRRLGAFFLGRQHAGHLRWEPLGERRYCGRVETGEVYERQVKLTDPRTGEEMTVRRITVELHEPTRDGDKEIHLLSNVPGPKEGVVGGIEAVQLAEAYLKRWLIEGAFFELTVNLGCEVNTLGYPGAALLCLCLGMSSYNLLAVVKGAIRAEKGEQAEEGLSGYYTAEEVRGTYRGMDIATDEGDWEPLRRATPAAMAGLLRQLARGIELSYYGKNPVRAKGPKTPRPFKGNRHASTHRLLNPGLFPPQAGQGLRQERPLPRARLYPPSSS